MIQLKQLYYNLNSSIIKFEKLYNTIKIKFGVLLTHFVALVMKAQSTNGMLPPPLKKLF